jgi:hypothetical protein
MNFPWNRSNQLCNLGRHSKSEALIESPALYVQTSSYAPTFHCLNHYHGSLASCADIHKLPVPIKEKLQKVQIVCGVLGYGFFLQLVHDEMTEN